MREKRVLASDNETELRPGMLVLVRDEDDRMWEVNVFSHCDEDEWEGPTYFCIGDGYSYCIPLAGNESLAGTFASIPEPRQDTDKPLEWGERVHVWHDDLDFKRIAIFCKLDSGAVPYGVLVRGGDTVSYWRYCERA